MTDQNQDLFNNMRNILNQTIEYSEKTVEPYVKERLCEIRRLLTALEYGVFPGRIGK